MENSFLLKLVLFAFIVYVLLMGQSSWHRNGLIEKLHNFVFALPQHTRTVLQRVLPAPLFRAYDRVHSYILNENNPILAILYFCLVFGGYVAFMVYGSPHVPNPYASSFHLYFPHVITSFCLGWFLKCCFSEPGTITQATHAHHSRKYHFDKVIYAPCGCRTCQFLRPARSKHCKVCNRCVARFDHHCPWIGTDVGSNNLWQFQLFLAFTSITCYYCCYISSMVLMSIANDHGLFRPIYGLTKTDIARLLLHEFKELCGLAFFTGVMGTIVGLFAMYTFYLICIGMTQNEIHKWKEIRWNYDHQQEAFDAWKELKKNAKKEEFAIIKESDLVNSYDHGILSNIREVFNYDNFTEPTTT